MHLISHRRNKIQELIDTPKQYGVEIDLRSWQNTLILQHDPFVEGEPFTEWIKHYDHGTLILNIKEEGIEYLAKEIVEAQGIQDYFFLDLSFPFLIKMMKTGESRIAARFSEYESLETVLTLREKIEWIWVDCFNDLPLTEENYNQLKEAGFKLCLVSPELQGRPEELKAYQETLEKNSWRFDAVCTKRVDLWS